NIQATYNPPPSPPQQQPVRQPLTFASAHYVPSYQLGAQNQFAEEVRKQAQLEQQQAQAEQDRRNLDDALKSGQVYPFGHEGYEQAWARAHGVEYETAWAATVGVDLAKEEQQWREHQELQRKADEQ